MTRVRVTRVTRVTLVTYLLLFAVLLHFLEKQPLKGRSLSAAKNILVRRNYADGESKVRRRRAVDELAKRSSAPVGAPSFSNGRSLYCISWNVRREECLEECFSENHRP